jgi:tetratricopeptide (TPR) repeat protein
VLLIIRIKRCESALVNRRLDEALELLRAADLRAHRRGQELTDRLLAALIERGRGHLAAGRIAPADEDCRKALALAGNTEPVAQLRAAVDRAMAAERERLGRREQAATVARRLVEQGQLTLAGGFAARAVEAGDGGADALVAEITGRRAGFEQCVTDAAAAIDGEDWDAAMQCLARARSLRPGAGDAHTLTRKLGECVAEAARDMIDEGRLHAAHVLLRRVSPICSSHAGVGELHRSLEQFQSAWACVREGRHVEARELLGRLSHLWPRAGWLRETIEQLSRAGDAIGAVRSGPLGLLNGDETIAMPARNEHFKSPKIAPAAKPARAGAVTRRRYLLHVDGAGSYLVLLGDTIDVGPVSASRPPDLALMTAANTPLVTLSRSDEDYFLNSRGAVAVNEKPVTSKLLASGDRIGLGPRCRIQFRRPNPASTSAVLHVSGARLPWGAVREVLLMDRELVIGPLAAAHVRTRDAGEQVVIQHDGDGKLLCRASEAIALDGNLAVDRVVQITPGARVVVGGLSFVVQAE